MDYTFPNPNYRARCLRVIDGDTIDVEIDLGLRCYRKERLRLLGVNTPEKVGVKAQPEAAAKATDFTANLTRPGELGWNLMLKDIKKDTDSFGRWLARIYVYADGVEVCVNDELIKSGNAKEFMK